MGADTAAAQNAVEALVGHYQAKARAVGRLGVAIGASTGVLVGSVPLSPLHFAWPIPTTYGFATLLAGLVVGVLIGYVIGDGRAQLYHRMAEQARLQLQLEQRLSANDQRMAQLLTALTARAAASAQHATQPRQPAAPPAPAPTPVPAAPRPIAVQPPAPVALPVSVPAPAPVQELQPAAVAQQQSHLSQVPAAASAPAAPPLSPPVSR